MTNNMARSSRRAHRALANASLACATALAATAGVGAVGGASASAQVAPYNIATLGFTDTAHDARDANGLSISNVVGMNASGRVTGYSKRWDSGGTGLGASTGDTAWYYIPDPTPGSAGTLSEIGLVDDDHLKNGEARSNIPLQINVLGDVIGSAQRYQDADPFDSNGTSAWFFRPGATPSTVRLGFFDAAHTRGDNISGQSVTEQNTTLRQLGAGGHAIGESTRYLDGVEWGNTAWIYNGNNKQTSQLGLTDADHTGELNQRISLTHSVNKFGSAVGTSFRFVTEGTPATKVQRGSSAWFYNGASNSRIGFTAADDTGTVGVSYQSSDSTEESGVVALNDAGHVIGTSQRYSGTSSRGQAAWRYAGGTNTLTRIGLFDSPEHTSSTGIQSSTPTQMNSAGHVVGHSTRYNNGPPDLGTSAWLFNGTGQPVKIGLTDTNGYERSDGRKDSTVLFLNNQGRAAGTSTRYSGNNNLGKAAWIYNGSGSVRIGLFEGIHETEHTRDNDGNSNDGEQSSDVKGMNDAGHVIGTSVRYDGASTAGQSAFFYNGSASRRIGLFDAEDPNNEHTSTDGIENSVPLFLNEEGQVVGTATRYNNSATSNGKSGWFYDDGLDTNFELAFSTSSLSETNTEISFLSDTGKVLGTYTKYSGTTETDHAFLWDFNAPVTSDPVMDRLIDLGALVEGSGSLSASDWAMLSQALEMSDLGHIRGVGQKENGNFDMPYLLTPVPEPTTLSLLAVSGLALLPRRRRRR